MTFQSSYANSKEHPESSNATVLKSVSIFASSEALYTKLRFSLNATIVYSVTTLNLKNTKFKVQPF